MNVSYYAPPRNMRFKGHLRKDSKTNFKKSESSIMSIEERLEKLELKLARAHFINRLLVVIGIGVFLALWFF